MLCAMSGQIPVEPVVSLKSGHLFEKRLLLKYLEQNQQRCPITSEELDVDKDVLAVQVAPSSTGARGGGNQTQAAATCTPDSASIPQLLATFQNEWDAVMLETFTLKQHLEKTRQELSHALYQHDAACRVIARLTGENTALRTKLSQRHSASGHANGDANGKNDVEMEDAVNAGLSAEAQATIAAKQTELAKQRKDFKKKDGPARAALVADLAETWQLQSSHTVHDSDKPGVLSVAIDPKNTARVLTTGVDKHAKLFDKQTQQLVATLSGHTKKVSHAVFHPTADVVVTASHDKTVKIWNGKDKSSSFNVVHSLGDRDDAATMASIHATGDYVISSSLDASWAFHDLRTGKLIARSFLTGERSVDTPLSDEALCIQFHPDGGIFGTGSKNKVVQMWDVRTLANVVTFDGHTGAVEALAFSENGYQLASGSHDGVVKFWDLRKLKSVFELDLKQHSQGKKKVGPIYDVCYDPSGTHLAVASSSVQILKEVGKTEWQIVQTFEDHKAAVTGVQFAPDSSYLASSSMDRSFKIYSR
ncbi:TPA: hypothetical protein N0F65_009835 [Lagenidium giganteum]|uniref:Pre-mRNA-processing factor 19 n=1 Tax=Lagenidium giganteum TaxID=4803 RepID=A0AAV2YVR8_9STRA|nr:TPA: hypothetical protein N0F65_009835 [Lagenidium giganteum]